MIKFIHTYTEKSINTLLQSGLFKAGHGLKLMHRPEYTAPVDFNTVAKQGSALHALLEELSCPFYIDRLQGGLGLPVKYPYDKELLSHYKNSKSIDFLGLQMHEWASNFRSDQKRIADLCNEQSIDPKSIRNNAELWDKVKDGSLSLFLEAYTPEEWSTLSLSDTRQDFLADCETLYKKRLNETDHLIFTTDSYFMAYRTAIANHAKMLLPEVGWQIPNMRVQIAYTIGMAKSAALPWGIYYECWYCNENGKFTIPYSLTDASDDWLENFGEQGYGHDLPMHLREHGGSSLSLMERAWVYAYFSGAQLIGEEYGICNTFRSVDSADLSPYGEVKKRFIELSERFEPCGEVFRPFAVVLPAEMHILDERLCTDYLDYPCDEDSFFTKEYMLRFIAEMESIFGITGKHGNMGHTLRNGGMADLAEIVHDDMPQALSSYAYLIDLTGKNELEKVYDNVIGIEEAKQKAQEMLPVCIPDSLHVSARKDGDRWQLLLMNNDGIQHKEFAPDVQLPQSAVCTALCPKDSRMKIEKTEGTGILQNTNGEYTVSLAGGEWIILTLF